MCGVSVHMCMVHLYALCAMRMCGMCGCEHGACDVCGAYALVVCTEVSVFDVCCVSDNVFVCMLCWCVWYVSKVCMVW